MNESRERPLFVRCPRCNGHKGISGKSSGPYVGNPATLPCPRCPNSSGEVDINTLTDLEKNPPKPIRYEREDNS